MVQVRMVTGLQTLNAPGGPSHVHTCHMIRCAGNLYSCKAEHADCMQAQLQPVCTYLAEISLHCNSAVMCVYVNRSCLQSIAESCGMQGSLYKAATSVADCLQAFLA